MAYTYDNVIDVKLKNIKDERDSFFRLVELGLDEYDNYEFISTARGYMSISEFNKERKALRQKYLNITTKNDRFDEACDILEEIFNTVSDKPFDESLVTRKNSNTYVLSGPNEPDEYGVYKGKTFLSAINYNNVFSPEEIDQLNNYERFKLTWTGYIDLGSLNQSIAKRYNRKLKQYVNSIIEEFESDNYILKLSSGTGNLELTFI